MKVTISDQPQQGLTRRKTEKPQRIYLPSWRIFLYEDRHPGRKFCGIGWDCLQVFFYSERSENQSTYQSEDK
jgi:hypothetical protein